MLCVNHDSCDEPPQCGDLPTAEMCYAPAIFGDATLRPEGREMLCVNPVPAVNPLSLEISFLRQRPLLPGEIPKMADPSPRPRLRETVRPPQCLPRFPLGLRLIPRGIH